MKRGLISAVLLLAASPLSHAGIVLTLDPTVGTATNAGTYTGGTVLVISASGTVSLNAPNPSLPLINPDGSLNTEPPVSCTACWAPGYQYFLPGQPYPTVAGGDGINHFPGGGANYDAFNGTNPAFAAEGLQSTDTTLLGAFGVPGGVLRFGAIAGTFTASPSATDWFLIGNGGTLVVPGGGGTLQIIVVDTFYRNNSGGFSVNVDVAAIPEPSAAWLALSGIAYLAFRRFRHRA